MTVTQDAGGFWRMVVRIAYDATMPADPFLFVRMSNDTAGTTTYTGGNTSSLKIWGYDVR
jgi:hypothetical protein